MDNKMLPYEERLMAYLDGELAPADRERIDRMLAANPAAKQLVEELRVLSGSIQSLPKHQLEADFYKKVLRAAEREVLLGRDRTAAPAVAGRIAPLGPMVAGPMAVPAAASEPSIDLATLPLSTAPRDGVWSRLSRPTVWASLTAAAALVVMIFSPDLGLDPSSLRNDAKVAHNTAEMATPEANSAKSLETPSLEGGAPQAELAAPGFAAQAPSTPATERAATIRPGEASELRKDVGENRDADARPAAEEANAEKDRAVGSPPAPQAGSRRALDRVEKPETRREPRNGAYSAPAAAPQQDAVRQAPADIANNRPAAKAVAPQATVAPAAIAPANVAPATTAPANGSEAAGQFKRVPQSDGKADANSGPVLQVTPQAPGAPPSSKAVPTDKRMADEAALEGNRANADRAKENGEKAKFNQLHEGDKADVRAGADVSGNSAAGNKAPQLEAGVEKKRGETEQQTVNPKPGAGQPTAKEQPVARGAATAQPGQQPQPAQLPQPGRAAEIQLRNREAKNEGAAGEAKGQGGGGGGVGSAGLAGRPGDDKETLKLLVDQKAAEQKQATWAGRAANMAAAADAEVLVLTVRVPRQAWESGAFDEVLVTNSVPVNPESAPPELVLAGADRGATFGGKSEGVADPKASDPKANELKTGGSPAAPPPGPGQAIGGQGGGGIVQGVNQQLAQRKLIERQLPAKGFVAARLAESDAVACDAIYVEATAEQVDAILAALEKQPESFTAVAATNVAGVQFAVTERLAKSVPSAAMAAAHAPTGKEPGKPAEAETAKHQTEQQSLQRARQYVQRLSNAANARWIRVARDGELLPAPNQNQDKVAAANEPLQDGQVVAQDGVTQEKRKSLLLGEVRQQFRAPEPVKDRKADTNGKGEKTLENQPGDNLRDAEPAGPQDATLRQEAKAKQQEGARRRVIFVFEVVEPGQ